MSTVGAVARLAAPAIGLSLLHTLQFLVDRAMLGHHSDHALASMQISGPVVWSLYSVLASFAVGTVALVGRAVGAGDGALAGAATRSSLALALGVGVAGAAVSVLSLPALLSVFPDAGPEVRVEAARYLEVVLPGLPLILLAITAGSIFHAAGDTRTPFLVGAAGNLLNVGLDWVLIFGELGAPPLGVVGAAIGSVASVLVQSVVLVGWLAVRRAPIDMRGRGGERAAARRVLRVSGPALAERLVQHAGFLGFVVMIGRLGPTAMAANQALISLESICFLSADGFGVAAATLAAQGLGAARPDEAQASVRAAVALGLGALGACGALFLVAPGPLLSLFTDDAVIREAGLPCMAVMALAQPAMALGIVLGHGLRGAGETRSPFVVTAIGGLGVRLSATWWLALARGAGLVGVWWGSTADWAVRAALLVWVFARGRWRLSRV